MNPSFSTCFILMMITLLTYSRAIFIRGWRYSVVLRKSVSEEGRQFFEVVEKIMLKNNEYFGV